jgi:hypothetical protein
VSPRLRVELVPCPPPPPNPPAAPGLGRPASWARCPPVERPRNPEHRDAHCAYSKRASKVGSRIGRAPVGMRQSRVAGAASIRVSVGPLAARVPRCPLRTGRVRVCVCPLSRPSRLCAGEPRSLPCCKEHIRIRLGTHLTSPPEPLPAANRNVFGIFDSRIVLGTGCRHHQIVRVARAAIKFVCNYA